jgi:excisionase family DNA binding protein
MDGIKLQIDPVQLEPLIRKVVTETLVQLQVGHPRQTCGTGDEVGSTPDALLWKAPEAAQALGISERSLWTLTQQGVIPHVKIGRSVRYAPGDLRAWIESQKCSGTDGVDEAG